MLPALLVSSDVLRAVIVGTVVIACLCVFAILQKRAGPSDDA